MSRSVWNSSPWVSGTSSGAHDRGSNVTLRVDLPDDVDLNRSYLLAGDHLLGNPYNGLEEETWNVRASSDNVANVLVMRNEAGAFSAGIVHAHALQVGDHMVVEPDGSVVSDRIVDRTGLRYLRETETIDPIDFGGSLTVQGKVQIGSLEILPEPEATEFASERLYVQGNMVVTGDVMALSDARIKTNVASVEHALDRVRRMRGVTYTRTDDARETPCLGLIAQEVRSVLPHVVHATKDGLLGVSYGNLVALLIEAIKELDATVQSMQHPTE